MQEGNQKHREENQHNLRLRHQTKNLEERRRKERKKKTPKRTGKETTSSIRTEAHAPNPTEIRVLGVGKLLKIESFKIPENPLEVGGAWREWVEHFEDDIRYFEITWKSNRVSVLKISGGKEIQKHARKPARYSAKGRRR